jgi:hypothetical protein
MKTVCKPGMFTLDIRRVFDWEASDYVVNRGYTYCPKHVWKENVRDINLEKGDTNE